MNHEFVLHQAKNRVWYGSFTHFDAYKITHGISTRLYGSSSVPFQSLNLGLHTGDEQQAVLDNRRRFATAVGFQADKAVTAQQVHSDTVAIVASHTTVGQEKTYPRVFSSTDALITAEPGIPLLLFYADCVPVLFFDPVRRVAAVSHAGWKGTVARIAAKTLLMMQDQFGVKPGDCLIGIGPSIGQCCYEVDEPVIDKLRQEFGKSWSEFAAPRGERWLLNLWEVNRRQLTDIGAADANIVISHVCTACNTPLYYSYRAEQGNTGRIGAVIQL